VKAIDAILFDPVGILVDEQGEIYEDAAPALAELAELGVKLIAVTSPSDAALRKAVADASLDPHNVIFLTDSEAGIRAAQAAGVNPVLMMNDPDEAMRLTAFGPAGGIVSLHELPDFIRFVAVRGENK
jgi:phosphoglycolate phosphatase-like HAD superfamily hydrolase